MDSEEEIENKSEIMAHNQKWSKLKALSILHSRYLSESRFEEAMRVKKLMNSEESKSRHLKGFYEDS